MLATISALGLTACQHISDADRGTVVKIQYKSKDYQNDEKLETTKPAYVYLPAGYDANDKETKYPVLYLMHGVQGNEEEWKNNSSLYDTLDRKILKGTAKPFIIVTPNGRSSSKYRDCSFDNFNAFYSFGSELRNDLIPYMEANFNVKTDRDGRAMAGLSMGGMQTINIGMCECLDLISWFGAFSAAPTSKTKEEVNEIITSENFNEYEINYFYNICGLQDNIAWDSASAAAKGIDSICPKLTDGKNFTWYQTSGAHSWDIWSMGFDKFASIVFKK